MSTDNVRVFLVDDERAVTDGLQWLLDSVNISSRAFSSADSFLAEVRQTRGPICAVLDLRMPEISGLALLDRLNAENLRMPLMFLSAHADVAAAVSAMQLGALDFMEKPFKPQAFLEAVNRLMAKAREQYEYREKDCAARKNLEKLSAREKEVLERILDGRTSKETAQILQISPKTVDVHRASILHKMTVGSVGELHRLLSRVRVSKP